MIKKIPNHIKIIIGLVMITMLFNFVMKSYDKVETIYNTTTTLKQEYNAVSQKQVTNYDGYYEMFVDKYEISTLNEETFLHTTEIIMNNRRDGQNVAWKWVSENQQIPYEEFTIFYKNLTDFVEERHKDNMLFEAKKQELVKQHNTILVLFPNNLINKVLRISPLVYKSGNITNTTKNKFK